MPWKSTDERHYSLEWTLIKLYQEWDSIQYCHSTAHVRQLQKKVSLNSQNCEHFNIHEPKRERNFSSAIDLRYLLSVNFEIKKLFSTFLLRFNQIITARLPCLPRICLNWFHHQIINYKCQVEKMIVNRVCFGKNPTIYDHGEKGLTRILKFARSPIN